MSNITEKALALSFKKLLKHKTIDKITVRDIVEDCEINRQTFYYHFKDIYDLTQKVFVNDIKALFNEHPESTDWKSGLLLLFDYVIAHKDIFRNVFDSFREEQLEYLIKNYAMPIIKSNMKTKENSYAIETVDFDFVADVFFYSLEGLILEWISMDMPKESKATLYQYFKFVDTCLDPALKAFSK